jgi:hypothetical protein
VTHSAVGITEREMAEREQVEEKKTLSPEYIVG